MKFCRISLLLLFLTSFKTFLTDAQSIDKTTDSIAQKMYWYALQNPSSLLYVHFDKNIYANNEFAWFTGYLLKSSLKEEPDVLSVALIRNNDRSVLAEGKFVMNAGISFGNLYVPDSLPTGDYSFVCYTNYLLSGIPTDVFIQLVTIRESNEPGFIATAELSDSITPGMDSAKVLVKAYTTDITLVKGADVKYFIGDRSNPLRSGKMKTNNYGEATVSIPLKQITAANNLLQTEVSDGKEMKVFNIKLPVYNKEVSVKFYPEGGNLVNSETNTIGWEVKSNDGEPLQLKAALYKDNKPFSSVTTNTYGMGKFSITPAQNSHYYLKLKAPEQMKDSASYNLPDAINTGPVISISNALATDTLLVKFTQRQAGSRWTLMIHNFRKSFLTASIVSTGRMITLKVPLNEIPKGLNTFTVLDSLERPWAERLFFAHFDKQNRADITTDTSSYGLRQKVEVKFKVSDAQLKPLVSSVSVSCAQDNRYDARKMTHIESYTYLQHELASLPFRTKWMSNTNDNKEYLEDVLLVKGWRRFTWQDMMKTNAKDTVQQHTPLLFIGVVINEGNPVKKLPELDFMKLPNIFSIKTDSLGKFEIPAAAMVTEENHDLRLFINDWKPEKYRIKVTDQYKEMNKTIAAKFIFDNYTTKSFAQNSQTVVLSKDERGKRMLDAVVTSKKDRNPAANICGDYVCVANVLNCPRHLYGGTEPVLGMRYHTARGSKIYTGCVGMKYLSILDGIYTKKEFYVTDYSNANVPESNYFSTMYWNHSVLTNDKGEAAVSFFTNDLPGKFRITIQGITSNASVVYGEHFFTVKKQ